MKLQFKNQTFQTTAVNSICDLFIGQENKKATFSVGFDNQMSLINNEYGFGNFLTISENTMIENMNNIQKRHHLPITHDLENNHFCIEMETGTGKTYVYTKTIFELNKRFGFTKFIIVVPSVAIREGVYKSLEITSDHFANIYNNVPHRFFIYSSDKLNNIRAFATNQNIEIMIMNIDAFKKEDNVINQDNDKLGGVAAMKYIRDTNPIVIIDEPQSVDNTDKSKEAIKSLNPLAVLRYSATHKEKINVLYRLTPIDAYQNGLVKQIVVSSNSVDNNFNKPYIKLLSVKQNKGFIAEIELDIKDKNREIKRKKVTIKQGDDLFLKSGERDMYDGFHIAGIDCTPTRECIEFTDGDKILLGKAIGDFDENELKKVQIKRTIETHLDKELNLFEKGIKVLSLFFIDKVENYRTADGDKGIYAKMFEECYVELMKREKYAPLKNKFSHDEEIIHNGYFSQDKKGFKDTKGNTKADYDTYTTIMKDKEWLLSFDCPLRFIWSHSTLKEGWDNPNVFQVCTLIEQKSTFTCRQKIGRGLRLCVDKNGERIEDKNINILHVLANESFSDFADKLQHEIEEETGVLFGHIQIHLFDGVTYEETIVTEKVAKKEEVETAINYMVEQDLIDTSGKPTEKAEEIIIKNELELPPKFNFIKEEFTKAVVKKEVVKAEEIVGKTYTHTEVVEKIITTEDATEIIKHFEKKDYITKTGKAKDTMKNDLANNTLDLPKRLEAAKERLSNILTSNTSKIPLRDASKEVKVKLNKQVFISPEFVELWDKIKQKTMFRINLKHEELISKCIADVKNIDVKKAEIITQFAKLDIAKSDVTSIEISRKYDDITNEYTKLPDILNILAEETLLTKKTIAKILLESACFNNFIKNPQLFLDEAIKIIKNHRKYMSVDGVCYVKLDGQEYYAQDVFNSDELIANLDKNAVNVEKSVQDYVVYDSETIEKPFAVALDNDPDVKLFFKIPSSFKIKTPIGNYNPDWAVYMTKDGDEKLFLVVETKGSVNLFDLRETEKLKIKCGEKHFESLDNNTTLKTAKKWVEVKV